MASGGGANGRSTNSGFSLTSDRNDVRPYYSPRSNTSYDSQPPVDPERMTLEVVNEFKRRTQNKVERGEPITQSTVESVVADIKERMNPVRNNINEWKRELPHETRACPDHILRESMAYGDDPHRVKPILQAKLDGTRDNDDPVDASLDSIAEHLRRLRDEMTNTPLKNLFHAVRNADTQNDNDYLQYVSRLFLSEAHHFTPGLEHYTFTNADNAVRAIRDTDYHSENPNDLLAILKTCESYEDVQGYIKKEQLKPGMLQNEPARTTTTTARFPNDTSANHRNDSFNRSNFNSTTSPYYTPLENSLQNPSQSSGRPFQSSSSTENDHRY